MIPVGNGEFRPSYESAHTEATAGHLRLARRGDTWYVLFAENDSSAFQLVGKQELAGTACHGAEFEMLSIGTDGGSNGVVWQPQQ